jgi:hypothetical protein
MRELRTMRERIGGGNEVEMHDIDSKMIQLYMYSFESVWILYGWLAG